MLVVCGESDGGQCDGGPADRAQADGLLTLLLTIKLYKSLQNDQYFTSNNCTNKTPTHQ